MVSKQSTHRSTKGGLNVVNIEENVTPKPDDRETPEHSSGSWVLTATARPVLSIEANLVGR